ncbi:NmrA/HSCARG family protein [Actinophytocola oryzae]|uniref:Uncharacterized protein YbjT (DUF2867 family) n=1 Tax=Actinophytocola oryzae TaxID=502181 RepID=A0A4R7VRU8_9PSEU|nr:NmrA/HSCARG family protein [Actinophytocola oryzae]TDV51947.1 uncharacterized protein YbjT (DUF2867 family) [Actinophytocola oryzae]
MTQILYHAVTGATGAQGGATARALLAAGQRVRALTRRPAAATQLAASGADVVYADFRDRSSVEAALKDVDTLFAVTTPFGSSVEQEVEDGATLVSAAAHLRHIAFTSATNADRATGIPHFDSKFRIERFLVEQDVPWTVLGPAAFMDQYAEPWHRSSYARGVLSVPLPPDRPLALVATEDIGAFAAHVLTHPEDFAGRRIDLASDELTGPSIASVLGVALGRPLRFEEAPISVAERYSPDLAAMFRYFGEVGMSVDVAALRREYPMIGWHRLADWAVCLSARRAPETRRP